MRMGKRIVYTTIAHGTNWIEGYDNFDKERYEESFKGEHDLPWVIRLLPNLLLYKYYFFWFYINSWI